MSEKITLDENGLISDNDKLYDKLDKYYDSDEFDKIVSAVLSIPPKQRSVKLRFRLISAYNNQEEYDKAGDELKTIYPECKTSAEKARFHYMFGYINFMNDKEMAAKACYEEGIKVDPEDTSGLELDAEVEKCDRSIQKQLDKLNILCDIMVSDIDTRCSEQNQKLDLSPEAFTMTLGFLSGVRKLPGFERSIGFGNFFTVYEGEQKKKALKWFKDFFNVTDRESFIKFYQTGHACNISRMVNDVMAYLGGNPNFDIEELNPNGKRSFFNTVMLVKAFGKGLPKNGILAWDLNEKIGFCRHAFACGLLTNKDYCGSMVFLHDTAKKSFRSVQEYIRSLIFGSGVYMFSIDDWNIKNASEFMKQMLALTMKGELPLLRW